MASFATCVTAIFALALFLSALLMFLLEPMTAKSVLPQFGGAPMVWNGCLVFFQAMILAGYAYSHAAVHVLGRRRHSLIYAALVVTAGASLFLAPASLAAAPDVQHPTWSLLTLLVRSIGFPFFVLSASAPTLQSAFSDVQQGNSKDPYFLYAISNAGSLIALFAYPLLVEPSLSTAAQRTWWAIGYVAFALLVVGCAALLWGAPFAGLPQKLSAKAGTADSDPRVWRQRLRWTAFAFVPSSLLLGVTSYVSTDIAAFPLLWIIPLALYLGTFIVAFAQRTHTWGRIAGRELPLVIAALVVFMGETTSTPWLLIPLHLLAFTMLALMCHGQLATDRPPPARLTEFYLFVSVGGVLGGAFNTFIAPLIFHSIIEYPVMVVAGCAIRAITSPVRVPQRDSTFERLIPLFVGVLTALSVVFLQRFGPAIVAAAVGILAVLTFSQSRRPLRFAAGIGAILLAANLAGSGYGRVLTIQRTFFGVYRVSEDASGRFRALFHGTTLHGLQEIGGDHRAEPLTYYHRSGPIGQAFEQLPQLSHATEIAVVGLGVGTLAAYAEPSTRWTFYEIDPMVERIARNAAYFTYLQKCGDQCRVVLGDARLSLARAPVGAYSAIILDAFSSDAIPVHLLTREALGLYLSRLAPDGILAFHISNRHLALRPVLARLAENLGLVAMGQYHDVTQDEFDRGDRSSEWVILAHDHQIVTQIMGNGQWSLAKSVRTTPLWTDDFSNIVSVLAR